MFFTWYQPRSSVRKSESGEMGSSHIWVNCRISDKTRGFPDGRLGSENSCGSVNSFWASENGMVCPFESIRVWLMVLTSIQPWFADQTVNYFQIINLPCFLKISRHLPTTFILTIICYSRVQNLLVANGSSSSFLIPENTVEYQSTMYILL